MVNGRLVYHTEQPRSKRFAVVCQWPNCDYKTEYMPTEEDARTMYGLHEKFAHVRRNHAKV